MSTKEQLIQEIEQSPEYIINEVLNFLLFLKLRLKERLVTDYIPENPINKSNSILDMIDEITQEIPQSELEELPTDLSQNLDYYLYGLPKADE